MYSPKKTLTLQRKSINNLMIMKPYEEPTMTVVELHQQTHLMNFSRSGYGEGGNGYSSSSMGGRSGYGDGGDGFGDSGMGRRSGYGMGSWDDSNVSSRSGYGDGGTGFD